MTDFLLSLYPHLRSLWVVWFLLLFVVMLVWVMRPSRRARYEADGRIPFRDEENSPNAAPGSGAPARRTTGRR